MSRRRKPNGVRSRSRSKPNFGYSGGAGCVASSATADPSRKEKKSVRTVFAQSTRPPFRINVAFLPESENDADAQHVDVGFDHVAAAHVVHERTPCLSGRERRRYRSVAHRGSLYLSIKT